GRIGVLGLHQGRKPLVLQLLDLGQGGGRRDAPVEIEQPQLIDGPHDRRTWFADRRVLRCRLPRAPLTFDVDCGHGVTSFGTVVSVTVAVLSSPRRASSTWMCRYQSASSSP